MMNQKGYTLIEFILYTALFSMIFVLLVSISVTTLRTRLVSNIDLNVQRNIDVAFHTIIDRVEEARTITEPLTSSSTITVTGDDVTLYPATFSVIDDKLMLSQAGGDPVQITGDDVRVIEFTANRMTDPLDGLQVILRLESANQSTPELSTSESLQTTVMLMY